MQTTPLMVVTTTVQPVGMKSAVSKPKCAGFLALRYLGGLGLGQLRLQLANLRDGPGLDCLKLQPNTQIKSTKDTTFMSCSSKRYEAPHTRNSLAHAPALGSTWR
jgi:hypothetical protein